MTRDRWTRRTTPDLLTLPYPFSQVDLLTPKAFADAARQRGITTRVGNHMNESLLEELHRLGLLVPFYRVDLDRAAPSRAIDITASLTARHVTTTLTAELYAAARDGRLRDPARLKHTLWATKRIRTRWPSNRNGYLYSQHQLLAIIGLRRVIADMRMHTTTPLTGVDPPVAGQVERRLTTWTHPAGWTPDADDLQSAVSNRTLAIVLSALDTGTWPAITKTLHHAPEAWYDSQQAMPPAALLAWLGLDPSTVRELSERLLVAASFSDNLGSAYELIRRVRSSTWKTMGGSVRVALDQRLSAEILARTADVMDAPAWPQQALGLQRISERHQSLDRTLSEFAISPHPQVVVGVEGESERRILPRVLDLIGLPEDPALLHIVDYNGTDSDLHLLAKHAAHPVVGRDLGDAVQLDRPFTRFLVLADAENKYATADDRRRQRKNLIDAIASTLPPDLRQDLSEPDARTVEILTWGKLPFEFAHYTDRQLARALTVQAGREHPKGFDRLVAALTKQRRHDPTPNVHDAWKGSDVGKPALNDELWPILERRIQKALQTGGKEPPILKAARRIEELVYWTQGQTIVLTRAATHAREQ